MSSLPSDTQVMMEGMAGDLDPAVLRTEMERGVPVQRLLNSDVIATLALNLYFATPAIADAFEEWYLHDIKRIGWFNMINPLNGQAIVARFRGGAIGTRTLVDVSAFDSRRQVTVEYVRS